MIECCGDRQQKCDGLEKWPFHLFVESLPMMLQAALVLLVCGLCRYMWSINASVAYTLIVMTGLGATLYTVVVIVGTSWYACPFQTPISAALRGARKKIRGGTWKEVRRNIWNKVRSGVVSSGGYFKRMLPRIIQTLKQRILPLLRGPLLPTANSIGNSQAQEPGPWLKLKPEDLATAHRANADDVQCVSWILRNITDPEALDAAVRLAGTIRWFDDGIEADPPYDSIVSTLEGCFDSAGKLYPGSRDRAYYSGRAMMWINSLAVCKSKELARKHPLPSAKYVGSPIDPDLGHLILVLGKEFPEEQRVAELLATTLEPTRSHTQWTSDVLLSRTWALDPPDYERVLPMIHGAHKTKSAIPLNATLNRLLSWCILLGSRPAEEVLNVQNKSYDISCSALQITHITLH